MTIPIKIIKKEDYEIDNPHPDQEEVWDSIAKAWNKYVVKKIPIVKEFLSEKKGLVVDLGCGDGRNMIPSDKITYYGVDFSAASLKHTLNRSKKEKIKVKLFKSKIDKLPDEFKSNMFDAGLFIATLHCLESKKEREKSLLEFYRVLKKGKEGLISVWNSEDPRFGGITGDVYMSWREQGICYMRYYYLYKKDELIGLLESVGFKISEIYKPIFHDPFSKRNIIIRVEK